MTYSIPISEAMRAALSDHTKRYIKVTVTHDSSPVVFFPTKISGNASEEFQSWNIQLKNYGEYSEGLFADDLATVSFSYNNSEWITMTTGYVSPEGMNREQGYVSDDIVSFDLVDRTKGKGTKRKPSSTVFAALKICDPSDASNSILHRLGSLMGITSFDAGLIQDVKDIVTLGEQVVWSELKLLRDAYKACLYFDYLGRLRFHSPLETGWTDPESEWTFVADPSHTLDSYSSRVIGKVRRTYNQVSCNRATSNLNLYEQRSLRVIYRDTTNWNGDLSQCSIVIQPGATYPESGVLSLNYKDPLTSEEYPYATNIQTPTIGQDKTFDICYSGGNLELISFNGSTSATSQQPGASQIILKNTGALACEIIKFEVRGEPFFQLSENKVEEVDSIISDEVDYVDLPVEGKYATSVEQIDKVLARHVEEGKVRTRHFSFASIFLPQIQREMVCTYIDVDGSEIACKVTTYSHKASGKTLDTMKTYVELDEVLSYVPSYNPRHEVTQPNIIPPQKGEDGAPGSSAKAVIINYDSDGLPVTSRGVPKISSIRFTLSLQNLLITQASDVSWVCSDPEVTLVSVPGDIYSVDLDTSEVSVDSFTVTATVSGIMGLVGISKRADGKPAPYNFRGVTVVPTETPMGEPLVAGDYFLWAASNAPAGSTTDPVIDYPALTKGEIYEYNGTVWLKSANGDLVLTLADSFADLSNDVDDTVLGNVIMKKLIALKAIINELSVLEIFLKRVGGRVGCIHSDMYLPDGTRNPLSMAKRGVYLSADGIFKAIDAELIGSLLTGDDAPLARIGIRDQVGIMEAPIHTGSGLDDFSIVSDGKIAGIFEIKITGINDFTDLSASWWQPVVSMSDTYWQNAKTNSSGLTVVVGNNGKIMYSTGLESWTVLQVGYPYQHIYGIAVNASGRFVINGYVTFSKYSDDGVNWFNANMSVDHGTYAGVAVNSAGLFVAMTQTGYVTRSSSGDSWSTPASIGASYFSDVYCDRHDRFFAVGSAGIWYSDDGVNWYKASETSGNPWRGIAENGSVYVVAGPAGLVAYSTDGLSWSAAFAPTGNTNYFTKVALGNDGMLVALHNYEYCYTYNGSTWYTVATDRVNGFIGCNRIGRFFYAGQTTRQTLNGADKESHRIQTGGAWGAWTAAARIPLNKLISFPSHDVIAQFANRVGHTINDIWAFEQKEIRGLVIVDSNGTEFFAASDNIVSVKQQMEVSANLPTAAALASLPLWSVYRDGDILKVKTS